MNRDYEICFPSIEVMLMKSYYVLFELHVWRCSQIFLVTLKGPFFVHILGIQVTSLVLIISMTIEHCHNAIKPF